MGLILPARPGTRAAPENLAHRVLEMREDSRLQWQLADMARTEAYEYFSLTRYLNQWQGVYEQVAQGVAVGLGAESATAPTIWTACG